MISKCQNYEKYPLNLLWKFKKLYYFFIFLKHQHQQMAQQMHHQYEKQLMEQEEIYKAKLAAANADSESRAQQIEQMAEKVSMVRF